MSVVATVLSTVTALAFAGAAAANAFDLGGTAKSFHDWGYPRPARFVTAVLELVGAGLILDPRTREAGVALLGVVIAGAVLTLLRARAPWRHLAPALGFATLLVAQRWSP